jgi:hypothetical protein
MRLREMQGILRENAPYLQTRIEGMQAQSGQPASRIYGRRGLLVALAHLTSIPAIGGAARVLLQNPLLALEPGGDEVIILDNEFHSIKNQLGHLKQRTSDLLAALDEALPKQDEHSLSIRLPDAPTLSEIDHTIGRLGVIFDQPVQRLFGEPVRFQNFDTGSAWIEIVAASELILYFVIKLVEASQWYRSYELDLDNKAEVAKRFKLDTKNLEALQATNEVLLKACAESMAKDLATKHAPDRADPETVNATMNAIREFSVMIKQGAEVRLALNAPAAAQQIFPKNNPQLPGPPPMLEPPSTKTEETDNSKSSTPDETSKEPKG